MGGTDLLPLNFFIYKYRWKVTEPALSDLRIQDWHLSVVECLLSVCTQNPGFSSRLTVGKQKGDTQNSVSGVCCMVDYIVCKYTKSFFFFLMHGRLVHAH